MTIKHSRYEEKQRGNTRVLNRSQHGDLCTALQYEIMGQISYVIKESGKLVSKNMNLAGTYIHSGANLSYKCKNHTNTSKGSSEQQRNNANALILQSDFDLALCSLIRDTKRSELQAKHSVEWCLWAGIPLTRTLTDCPGKRKNCSLQF